MLRENVADLLFFLAVAREKSFTRAAAQLGVSQSALSHTVRQLEERMGVRLLTRTTRSVSPTPAGERLLESLTPRFQEIEDELVAVTELREKPAGTVRLTAMDYAINDIIWPKLAKVLKDYPDINVEIVTSYGFTDIVAEKFDAGIRLGESVSVGMVAARISPDIAFAVAGAPEYFAERPKPLVPQDLTRHKCINLRLPSHGGNYVWEFEKNGQDVRVRVEGQITCTTGPQIMNVALDGYGLCHLPEGMLEPAIRDGRLVRVLEDWTPPWTGYHIYYPSRRQPSAAFAIVLAALRHRE
ncbi:DNA-binding transcriptional LysR family regulator [Neorhizobium huautlense]|uniref:DNA-binding transcriptional LysR family regulator n=1 Tax=Neorhizobium huautlense TaxID=67774 RepID=A0ABT9Q023_9HYPH|nr:LysR family transcriptional regulator [Neorhizobium huautlense]MDP9840086.1 DNA-binding transcriptional LysR family regulator [Neorhizobium huautlense]